MALNKPEIKKQKSLISLLLKVTISLVSLFIFFIVILFLIFYIFKDDISNALLLNLNKDINGKISFSDISLTALKHFPDVALKISNLKVDHDTSQQTDPGNNPLLNMKEVYLSINIVDLISSKINVTEITLEKGYLNFIIYPDSLTSFEKLIRQERPEKISVQQEEGFFQEMLSDLKLRIDKLTVSDLKIYAESFLTNNKLIFDIRNFDSKLSHKKNKISADLVLDLNLDSLMLNKKLILSNNKVFIDSEFFINTDSLFVKIVDGKLNFDETSFDLSGTFDSKNEGEIDLKVSGQDLKSGYFSGLLSKTGKKNLKKGSANFNASLKGKTYTQFPELNITFGLTDVSVLNPVTNRLIKNLNLRGNFYSGKEDDFSKALLKIDTLYADFPDGRLRLSGDFKNFNSPELDIVLFLEADVTGFDDIFNMKGIDDLHGKVKINERYKGKFNRNKNIFVTEQNHMNIFLDGFGFSITDALKIDSVDGTITRKNDNYLLKDLRIIYKDTDLLINGELENLQYLLLGVDREITADLTVKSPIFDLPEFLFFDPSIKRDFNYRILDIDASVLAKTTTTKALEFKSFPEIEFSIKKINATVENFVPPIKIKSGTFKISENILGFNLKADKFKTEFLDGNFDFSGEYNTSKAEPYYIKSKAVFSNIYPYKLFHSGNDSIPESLNGKLSGSLFIEVQFPTDTAVLKFINLNEGNLTYEFLNDTVSVENLKCTFDNIYFNDKTDPNPLATLSAKGKLKADLIISNEFKINEVNYTINVSEGTYKLKSNVTRLFGDKSSGISEWTLKPFAEIPSFSISSNVKTFYAEKMLESYFEKRLISGPLSLSMFLSSKGTDWDEIVHNLNGEIVLSGENLVIKGIDADEILEQFKRSQSFNLVDLGGVLLAGPVGILVTKGTDYARLLVIESGEKTIINKLVSNWVVHNGDFRIEDAAFTTAENRIALKGSINLAQDSLNLVIALLDQNGCSTFHQEVSGSLDSPVRGNVEVVGTIMAPVTGLYDDIVGNECIPFYKGVLKHPK